MDEVDDDSEDIVVSRNFLSVLRQTQGFDGISTRKEAEHIGLAIT